MREEIIGRIGERLRQSQQVLITAHIRPDGDAVGSVLGLGLALQAAGKQVTMALQDGVPASLRHLSGSAQVVRQPNRPAYDTIIVVDSSDLQRVGDVLVKLRTPDICIDHHVTNLMFAELNLVEPEAVATAAILARVLPKWGLELSEPVAAALMTGIISDTIGFRTSNVTPEALRLAADLMDRGANLPELYGAALLRRSFQAAHYWGFGLARIQRQDNLVWTSLTLADREAAGYPGNDDADLVNILSTIQDSAVCVILIEQKGGKVKVSWRAQPGWDVSGLALAFGGGGHAAAAGAEIAGTLAEVEQQVLAATSQYVGNAVASTGL